MKIDWSQVMEGWRNRLFPPEHLKELIKQTKEERLEICKPCPHNSTENKINNFSTCKICSCPLKSKASALSAQCPDNRWMAVLTKEEQQELNNQ